MSWAGWLLPLQLAPGDVQFAWYLGGFILVLLAVAVGLGLWMLRTETGDQPVDSEQLINAFEEPVVILDSNDEVLLANVPFRKLFGSEIADQPIEDVLDSHPALRDAIAEREETVVGIEHDGKSAQYSVQCYPIGRQPRPPQKRVVLLYDVTEHHERQAQLEAENEQLDQFASLISHDLRNPLDVAIGRTNAVKEAIDDPELEMHLARTQDSHERMRQIITDVLALAREGHDIGNLQRVPLETVAMDAWSHVDTDQASLVIDTQLVIEADRERLTRIFENLFRNAIQHGGEDVSIEVGALDSGDGFFVADDGDGIPPEDRDSVFDAGYTSCGEGTGLGLAIVASIAGAHGWTTSVTEAEGGGARFEFVGVEPVPEELTASAAE